MVIAGVLLGGCAETNFLYRPSQQATAQVSGLPAARYAIPPERPQGEVMVVTTGVTEIKPENAPQRALFARVIVSNNSDDAVWTLDTRKQAAIVGAKRVPPAYANTFGEPLPIVQIPKGEKRTIDFYFPVPPGTETNSDLPQFDLSWNVETGSRVVAERTSFERYRVEPAYYGGYYGYPYYGYGYPYYPYSRWGYYDPFWGPHYSIYYGGGWGWGRSYWHGGYGHGGYGGGGYVGGGGAGRGSYSRPSVQRR